MATMTIDEALAHADIHAVPGQALCLLAAEVRKLRMAVIECQEQRDNYKHRLFSLCPSSGGWIGVTEALPEKSEDVLVTILVDGMDIDWRAGFWDGEHWYTLERDLDEPVQVNDGCNFVVKFWAKVNPATNCMED